MAWACRDDAMTPTENRPPAGDSECHDAMLDLLEWIWGKGFVAPDGEGNVVKLAGDLDL